MGPFEPQTFTPDAVDLFAFSAAIWLTHRIHYDQDYTTTVEQHPALLVHGPLQAVYLTQVVRRHFGHGARIVRLQFRHQAPVYLGETLTCGGEVTAQDSETGIATCEVWAEMADGRRATVGVAEVATH
jgi:3-methylfumaryl-CoA hydratase